MRFSKIKYDGKQVALVWTTKKPKAGGATEEVVHHLTCGEHPVPAFARALQAFVPFVLTTLELPRDYGEGVKVTGLSINEEEKDGRLGLVATCQKKLELTNAPVIFNTPHLRERLDEEMDAGFLPSSVVDLIDAASNCAHRYVEGERQQATLFDQQQAEPEHAGV